MAEDQHLIAEIETLLAQKRESVQNLSVELRALKRVATLRPAPAAPPYTPVQAYAAPPMHGFTPQPPRGAVPVAPARETQAPFSYQPAAGPAPSSTRATPQVEAPPERIHPPVVTGAVRGALPLDTPRDTRTDPAAPQPKAGPYRSLRGGAPILRNRGPDNTSQ